MKKIEVHNIAQLVMFMYLGIIKPFMLLVHLKNSFQCCVRVYFFNPPNNSLNLFPKAHVQVFKCTTLQLNTSKGLSYSYTFYRSIIVRSL